MSTSGRNRAVVWGLLALAAFVDALSEIVKWAYDQMVPENAILGKLDTIIDLVMDILGGVAAGIVSAGMIKAKE